MLAATGPPRASAGHSIFWTLVQGLLTGLCAASWRSVSVIIGL